MAFVVMGSGNLDKIRVGGESCVFFLISVNDFGDKKMLFLADFSVGMAFSCRKIRILWRIRFLKPSFFRFLGDSKFEDFRK
jgi:hypothetical protein